MPARLFTHTALLFIFLLFLRSPTGPVRTRPYPEAVYEVVALDAGGIGVKASTSEASPTTVSSFETVAAAEAWIASHPSRIQTQSQPRSVFRRPVKAPRLNG